MQRKVGLLFMSVLATSLRRSSRSNWARHRLSVFASLAIFLPSLPAQTAARDAASRRVAIDVFAEPQYLSPADGSGHSVGLAAGADFTRFFRTPVLPSLEVRVTYGPTGSANGETTALVGARVDLPVLHLGRFHPYGDFLVGTGTIHFAHPAPGYPSDNSTVYYYGGGFNYDLPRHLSLQAEFQPQHWNLGNRNVTTTFTPYAIDVGARYRIPFGRESAR